jgi:hypothetical protein
VLGGAGAQDVQAVDRLVKHGLVALEAGGLVGGPDQELLGQAGLGTRRLPGVLEVGQRRHGEQRAGVAVRLRPWRQPEFLKLGDQADPARQRPLDLGGPGARQRQEDRDDQRQVRDFHERSPLLK